MTPEALVRSGTSWAAVPFVPEIRLRTAAEPYGLWDLSERDSPPFWAFPWAGGQALARYLLDHPDTVRGRHVLDVASGSGLVAIAAAKAGAAGVTACDVDPNAVAAIAINARANETASVTTGVFDLADPAADDPPRAQVVLAADVFYQREFAAVALRFLCRAAESGAEVFVADPGRAFLPASNLTPLTSYQVPVLSVLEDKPVKDVTVYRVSLRLRDHDGARGGDHDDGRIQHRRRGRPARRVGAAHHPGLERQLPAAPPHRRHHARRLDHVTGQHRRAELDVGVRGEQALVTVHPHARFRGHIPEHPQHVRPVHQPAAVVGIAVLDVAPLGDGEPDGHDAAPVAGASACTR